MARDLPRHGPAVRAFACLMVVGALASCYRSESRHLVVSVRNDSPVVLVVELDDFAVFEVAPHTKARLTYGQVQTIGARVFRSDCVLLGSVKLTLEHPIIYVDPQGVAQAISESDQLYTRPSPFVTPTDLVDSAAPPGCSSDMP